MKTLVLGLGNPILSDDSVGFRVIQGLRARFSRPGLTLMESSASGLGLLDLIIGYDRVIFIDAIQTEDGQAGKIYRLNTENLGGTCHLASSHGINLATAVELGEKLGMALPQQIIIFAIEVVDVTTFSERCTPEVEKAVPLAVSMIAEELGGD
ncbi:MAG: hydrogenase maturation protease [Dehalococcoidales bacterium]